MHALRHTPPRNARGFTIVEMAVTLALLAILIAWSLPKVAGAATFAEDQKAQTTVSGALDTVVESFVGSSSGDGRVPLDGPGCTDPADPPAARQPLDRDHRLTASESDALASGSPQRALLVASATSGYLRTGSDGRPFPTNCPVFVNPGALAQATGDVRYVSGYTPSTTSSIASIAASATSGRWRVAVAVRAPSNRGSVAACWVATRDFPQAGSTGAAQERYFVDTTAASGSSDCTAAPWLSIEPSALTCKGTDGPAPADAGSSWRRPCGNYVPTS